MPSGFERWAAGADAVVMGVVLSGVLDAESSKTIHRSVFEFKHCSVRMQVWHAGVRTRRASRSARRSSPPRSTSSPATGYRRTSVRELADAVGLSQAGLLHYFSSKEELFQEILRKRDEVDMAAFEPTSATNSHRRVLRTSSATTPRCPASCSSTPRSPPRRATPSTRRTRSSSSATSSSAACSVELVRDEQAAGQHRPRPRSRTHRQPLPRRRRRPADPVDARPDDRHGRPRRLPLAPRHAQGLSGCRVAAHADAMVEFHGCISHTHSQASFGFQSIRRIRPIACARSHPDDPHRNRDPRRGRHHRRPRPRSSGERMPRATRSAAFLGIPFAEAPVGDLRFAAPVPHAPVGGRARRDSRSARRPSAATPA